MNSGPSLLIQFSTSWEPAAVYFNVTSEKEAKLKDLAVKMLRDLKKRKRSKKPAEATK